MFGGIDNTSLNEESKFVPKSPYAVGKLFAHEMSKVYRESYDIFAVNGILFNHESPMRGETFVTRKISKAVGRISQGIQTKLTLGNIDAFRDWGFAGDYVKGMYLMMQHDKPDDWVLSSDETHTVKEFLEIAFSRVNLNWEDFVITSEKYQRPNEVVHLLGDSSKARKILNWKPEVSFNGLVEMMVDYDIKEASREKLLLDQNLLTPTWEHPV
jgi:GDPmannose 4,6-dehydratase